MAASSLLYGNTANQQGAALQSKQKPVGAAAALAGAPPSKSRPPSLLDMVSGSSAPQQRSGVQRADRGVNASAYKRPEAPASIRQERPDLQNANPGMSGGAYRPPVNPADAIRTAIEEQNAIARGEDPKAQTGLVTDYGLFASGAPTDIAPGYQGPGILEQDPGLGDVISEDPTGEGKQMMQSYSMLGDAADWVSDKKEEAERIAKEQAGKIIDSVGDAGQMIIGSDGPYSAPPDPPPGKVVVGPTNEGEYYVVDEDDAAAWTEINQASLTENGEAVGAPGTTSGGGDPAQSEILEFLSKLMGGLGEGAGALMEGFQTGWGKTQEVPGGVYEDLMGMYDDERNQIGTNDMLGAANAMGMDMMNPQAWEAMVDRRMAQSTDQLREALNEAERRSRGAAAAGGYSADAMLSNAYRDYGQGLVDANRNILNDALMQQMAAQGQVSGQGLAQQQLAQQLLQQRLGTLGAGQMMDKSFEQSLYTSPEEVMNAMAMMLGGGMAGAGQAAGGMGSVLGGLASGQANALNPMNALSIIGMLGGGA